jgi:hypothetical protein
MSQPVNSTTTALEYETTIQLDDLPLFGLAKVVPNLVHFNDPPDTRGSFLHSARRGKARVSHTPRPARFPCRALSCYQPLLRSLPPLPLYLVTRSTIETA